MWTAGALTASCTSLTTVLSAFYLYGGMTEGQISVYLAVAQVVNIAVSLLCAGITSASADSRKAAGWMYLLCGISWLPYIPICLFGLPVRLFTGAMFVLGLGTTVFSALRVIYDYKLPCEVLDMRFYSEYTAYLGLFSGIAGMVIGIGLPLVYDRLPYAGVTAAVFALAAACMALGAFCIVRMKPISAEAGPAEHQKIAVRPWQDLKRLLANRDFRVMLVPNTIRGVSAGLVSMLAVIALREEVLTQTNVTMMTAVNYAGTFLSCFLYVKLVRRFGIPVTGLVGAVLFCLVVAAMGGGTGWFLVVYGIAATGNNLAANAFPDMVYHSVPQEIISPFHTWRLALMALGTAISTPIFGALLPVVAAEVLLVIGAAGLLLCALGYYLFYRKQKML